MPDSFRRLSFRLLAAGAFTFAVSAVFLIGFELGGGRMSAPGNRAAAQESLRVHLFKERDTLRTLLAESERQRVVLERASQIDAEARHVLREELKEVQEAHLELSRELTYLKRLARKGGRGAVQVYDMRISRGQKPREYLYSFTISQLIQGFGRSTGDVTLAVEGVDHGESLSFELEQLPTANPKHFGMDFEHFQSFQGTMEIPEGLEPRSLVVSVEPDSDLVLPTSAAFSWELSGH